MRLVPNLLSYLDEHAPNIMLETVPLDRHGVAKQMNGGEIDLAIGVLKPLGAGFFRQRFNSNRFVCLVRKEHPTVQGSIDLEQFLHASFIEYEPTGGSYLHFLEHADRLFDEMKLQRQVSVKLAYLSGIERMIASSNRIAVVTDTLVPAMRLGNIVQVLDLPFEIPPLDVTLQWHERIHKDPAQVWLRAAITGVAENLGENEITPTNTEHYHNSLALAAGTG